MKKLSFKPWHGQKYEKFNILITLPDRKKRIGRLIAPNHELALIKARELFPGRVIVIEKREKLESKEKQITD